MKLEGIEWILGFDPSPDDAGWFLLSFVGGDYSDHGTAGRASVGPLIQGYAMTHTGLLVACEDTVPQVAASRKLFRTATTGGIICGAAAALGAPACLIPRRRVLNALLAVNQATKGQANKATRNLLEKRGLRLPVGPQHHKDAAAIAVAASLMLARSPQVIRELDALSTGG